MKVQVVGINHTTAPVALRERVGFDSDALRLAYQSPPMSRDLRGLTVLSTCNRTELYVAGSVQLSEILRWWERHAGIGSEDLNGDYLYWYQEVDAVRHLFRVAAGLDSMILGETQILGQVKSAYLLAQASDQVGALHRVFHAALKVGKRARTETGIGQNALSMGHAVAELAGKVFGSLSDRAVLLVGAGEMAELAGRHLRDNGVGRMTIINRSEEHALSLAGELDAGVASYDALPRLIAESDIIVTTTRSPHPVVTEAMCRRALRSHRDRLRFFFDLAVPRDIEPAVAQISSSIFVYNIDDVKAVVGKNRMQREKEAVKVDRIIGEEIDALKESLAAVEMGPVIRSLRQKAESIRTAELDRVFGKLPELTTGQRAVIEQATRLMVSRLLNDPMVSMRRWGSDETKRQWIEAVAELFQLAPDEAEGAVLAERLELAKPEG